MKRIIIIIITLTFISGWIGYAFGYSRNPKTEEVSIVHSTSITPYASSIIPRGLAGMPMLEGYYLLPVPDSRDSYNYLVTLSLNYLKMYRRLIEIGEPIISYHTDNITFSSSDNRSNFRSQFLIGSVGSSYNGTYAINTVFRLPQQQLEFDDFVNGANYTASYRKYNDQLYVEVQLDR